MILREDKKFWLMLDISGAVTLMRRDDFAYVWLPRGEEAKALTDKIKAAQAADPSGEAVLAIYETFKDRFQPLEATGFLPAEIFFRREGERFAAEDVSVIQVYPRASGDFAISLNGPRNWVEATTAESMDEAHRLGVALATRFKAELVDLAAMYHSPWVEQVLAGSTYSSFSNWLQGEIGPNSYAHTADFVYQGWMMFDGEADRPWWAPHGHLDPVSDLNLCSTRGQCLAEDDDLAGEDFAHPTRIRVLRGSGAIQVLDEETRQVFREISRQEYYDSFGMKLPGAPEAADEGPSP